MILTLALHTLVARMCVFCFVLIINAADDCHMGRGRGGLWAKPAAGTGDVSPSLPFSSSSTHTPLIQLC